MTQKKAKRSREYLTPDEVERLLTAAKEGATRNPERDHAILAMLYRHGLRVSELCDLRLSDIDLNEATLYLRHQKSGERSVHPLFKPDVAAIRKWLAVRATMAPREDFLFVSEQRTRINRATVWLMIGTVSREAGLSHLKVHPHSLRHSLGFKLVNDGHDVRKIQDYLGHKSIQTTVRYTKLRADRFDKLF
jgi:type 1 fimbriae regulatory protein FimB